MEKEKKVFIRGKKGYGQEVISALECRGGVNRDHLNGNGDVIYYINHDDTISSISEVNELGKFICENYQEVYPYVIKDGTIMVRPANSDNPETAFVVVKSRVTIKIPGTTMTGFNPYLMLFGKSLSVPQVDIQVVNLDGFFPVNDGWESVFHSALRSIGKEWDAENKQLIGYVARWEPDEGDEYYYVDNDGEVESDTWDGAEEDNARYNLGNCFRSNNQAEQARKVLRETLINCHRNDDADE